MKDCNATPDFFELPIKDRLISARLLLSLLLAALLAMTVAANAGAQEPETIAGGEGLNLAVYEAGNPDGPPIVFIHGLNGNHLAWQLQFSGPLAEEFRLIAFDLRGHGASDKPLEPEHYTDSALWANDIAAIIDSMNLDRPVLVGWSYGGYIIADYIRAYGEESLGGLVFAAAVTKMGTEEAQEHLTEEFLGTVGGMFSADVATNISATRAFLPLLALEPLDRDSFEVVLSGAMMVPPEIRLAMFSRELDNDDVLAAIESPTLVVHGAGDRIVRVSSSEHLADTISWAELFVYDGVGHLPFLEDAERFDRDLAEFVRGAR